MSNEGSDKNAWMRRLIWVFAGRTYSKAHLLISFFRNFVSDQLDHCYLGSTSTVLPRVYHYPLAGWLPRFPVARNPDHYAAGLYWCRIKVCLWEDLYRSFNSFQGNHYENMPIQIYRKFYQNSDVFICLGEAVLTSTHNLCFWAKNEKQWREKGCL